LRLLLFTGKGGVGKTTLAAATAVHAARCGVRTLLLSLEPDQALSDVIATPGDAPPAPVPPGLSVRQVDPDAAGRSPDLAEHLRGIAAQVEVDPALAEDVIAFPGAQDVLALLAIRKHATAGECDLLVIDGPATAEMLRMLSLPEAVGRWLRRMLPVEQRIRRALAIGTRVPARGADEPPPHDHLAADADRLHTRLVEARAVLTAPSASIRLVLTPESAVLAHARRAWSALALHGYLVDGVVANRVRPDGAAHGQVAVLTQIEASFAGLTVRRAGLSADEPCGVDALARLGAELYGPATPRAGTALLAEPGMSPPMQVRRDGEQFLIQLELPRVSRQDVDLSRHGDDLLVGVGLHSRAVTLPSALRRCRVVGASLRDGRLQVRFEPDPALWRSS